LPPVVDRARADDQRGQDQRDADPRQEPPPVAAGGIVLERGDQRRHRRPALARFGSQATDQRAAHPRRHFVVLGNWSEGAPAHIVEQLQ
jgi:hypothetical protein